VEDFDRAEAAWFKQTRWRFHGGLPPRRSPVHDFVSVHPGKSAFPAHLNKLAIQRLAN
jgi:hypothetical protein